MSNRLKPGHDPVGVYSMCASLMCFGNIFHRFPSDLWPKFAQANEGCSEESWEAHSTTMLSSGLGQQAGVFPMSHGGRPDRGKAGMHHLEQLLA